MTNTRRDNNANSQTGDEPSFPFRRTAVLYDDRPKRHRLEPAQDRGLIHLMGVFEETTTGDIVLLVKDGTHTSSEYLYGAELKDALTPAGWSCPIGQEPADVVSGNGREHHPTVLSANGGTREECGDSETPAPGELFHVERHSDYPRGEEPACADCGSRRDLIGPFSHEGDLIPGGDMVCVPCADTRGADLTHCTCGTSSTQDVTCPGCQDYLGGATE